MKHFVSKNTHFSFILLFLLLGSSLNAQEVVVNSFQKLDRDLIARTQERLDLNDEPCAVVRVAVPKVKEFVFEGNVVGEVIYNPGEAIVYMPEGSRNLTVKSEEYGMIKYDFPEKLEKQVAYRLDLKLILSDDKKTRTLVMPVVGVGSTTSFGIMVGIVKKTGGYVKAKTNLQSFSSNYECNSEGMITGSSSLPWYGTNDKQARLAITGGLLQRLARPLYLYVGAGYGYNKIGWELANGEWAENVDGSSSGIEAEAGAIFRMKNFALSAGVQSNSFKYMEATVGIGIMF